MLPGLNAAAVGLITAAVFQLSFSVRTNSPTPVASTCIGAPPLFDSTLSEDVGSAPPPAPLAASDEGILRPLALLGDRSCHNSLHDVRRLLLYAILKSGICEAASIQAAKAEPVIRTRLCPLQASLASASWTSCRCRRRRRSASAACWARVPGLPSSSSKLQAACGQAPGHGQHSCGRVGLPQPARVSVRKLRCSTVWLRPLQPLLLLARTLDGEFAETRAVSGSARGCSAAAVALLAGVLVGGVQKLRLHYCSAAMAATPLTGVLRHLSGDHIIIVVS